MSTVEAPREELRDTGGPPPMLHWLDPKRPMHALCGKKLVKLVGIIGEAECVVCTELKRS